MLPLIFMRNTQGKEPPSRFQNLEIIEGFLPAGQFLLFWNGRSSTDRSCWRIGEEQNVGKIY